MKLKKITTFLASLLLLASCGSSAKDLNAIKESGSLVISTNAEFAPFEFIDGSDYSGIDMDIIKAYAQSIGVKAEIKDMDFDAALLSVAKKKVDVAIAAITVNAKREKTMSFSNPYYSSNQVVIVKEDSSYASLTDTDEIIAALSASKGKIGCQRGTTGQYYIEGSVDWEFDGIAGTQCITYDTGALACKDLVNGTLQAVVIDSAPADLYVKKTTGIKVLPAILTEEEYAIAVTKGNTSVVESINSFISTIKANGTFDSIVATYYGE